MGIFLDAPFIGEGGEERGVDMSFLVDLNGSQGTFNGEMIDNLAEHIF
jgi:hypothetical protein